MRLQNLHYWVGNPRTGGCLSLQGFPQGVRSPNPTSSSPGPAMGKQAAEHQALSTSTKACRQESQRALVNRDSTLKGHTHNHTCSRTQGRSSHSKGASVRPTCWSWRASWRGRKQMEFTLATYTVMTFGSSFYH